MPGKPKAAPLKVSGELTDAVRKLLDQKFNLQVGSVNGNGAHRAVTDAQELKSDDKLIHLGVTGTDQVAALDDPATLAALEALPESIGGQTVNGFGVQGGTVTAEHLRRLRATLVGKNLSYISWHDVKTSGETVTELTRFKKLVFLSFYRVRGLSGKSFQSVAVAFPDLYRIDVVGLDLDPSFLSHLRGVKLQWFEIVAMPQIDDGCVESLAAIKTLTRLTLAGCKLTPEGVKRLAAALPLCRIEWDGGVIEPTPAK